MRSTRMAAVVAGVVMVAGLTACNGAKSDNAGGSGGGSGKSPLEAALASLKTASEQTDGKKSAKVDGEVKNGPSTQTMKGAMDWSDGMRMDVDITQSGGQSPVAGKPMKALYTPTAMFMNMGAAGMPVGGKNWVKYDYDALAKKMGPAGALLKDQMNNNNPNRAMQLLIASGKVKEAGKEDVRGVQATHYTGTLSVSELTRMQSKSISEQDLKALEAQLKAAGTENETIDLWISSDNLLVKKREQMTGGATTFDSTVYYSDYGTKVTVTEPPAGDTVDFDKVSQP
ncbi:hypothetical protein ACGFOU_06445 [Streptomyces sp. NPDC048595]|uniref:hypothetical protein n=1 Tax=Streptomyces sp. NPDC048595 TaxID=3365576 RepID=UPI003723B56F